jgi:hypothetical protein
MINIMDTATRLLDGVDEREKQDRLDFGAMDQAAIVAEIKKARKWYEQARERYERAVANAERVTAQYGNPRGVRISCSRIDGDNGLFKVAERREEMDEASGYLADLRHIIERFVASADVSPESRFAYLRHYRDGYSLQWIAEHYPDYFANKAAVQYDVAKTTAQVIAARARASHPVSVA